jgi:hypothetical protein
MASKIPPTFAVIRALCLVRHLSLGSMIAAAAIASASSAHAEPTAADRETARALMDDGDKKFAAKDYSAALKLYQGAHAIMDVPSTGYAVAKTHAALGLLVEARDAALQVTRMPSRPGEPAPFTRARSDAATLANDLATRIGSLLIDVQGPPAGTDLKVDVDGVPLPSAVLNLPRKTNPGKHVVSASAPGYAHAVREVTLKEGETAAVTIELQPIKAAAAAPAAAAPGNVAVPTLNVDQPVPSGKSIGLPVYLGFGVGAAGVIVGSIAGLSHLSKVSKIKDDYCNGGTTCRPGFDEARDDAGPSAVISNIGFGIGAVGIAVGVIFLVAGGTSSPPAGAWIAPTVGVGSVGAVGAF